MPARSAFRVPSSAAGGSAFRCFAAGLSPALAGRGRAEDRVPNEPRSPTNRIRTRASCFPRVDMLLLLLERVCASPLGLLRLSNHPSPQLPPRFGEGVGGRGLPVAQGTGHGSASQ